MLKRLLPAFMIWLSRPIAHAQGGGGGEGVSEVDTQKWDLEGSGLTTDQIVGNIIEVGTKSIVAVCTAIFIIGALLFSTSAGDEKRKSTGKDLMIGAVMGVAVVAGAKGIFKIVYFVIYG